MWKEYIIKIVLFIAFFVGAVVLVSYIGLGNSEGISIEMENSSLPVVYMKYGDEVCNRILGYKEAIDTSLYRESIIAVDDSKKVTFVVNNQSGISIKKIVYELRSRDTDSLIENGELPVDSRKSGTVEYSTNIRMSMDTGKEYTFVVRLYTSDEDSIRYYSRIVRLGNSYVANFLSYVKEYNNQTFVDKSAEDFEYSQDNLVARSIKKDRKIETNTDNLGHVTQFSDMNILTWGNLTPSRVTEVVPVIKEVNENRATVMLTYVIASYVDGINSQYFVREYYELEYNNSQAQVNMVSYNRYTDEIFTHSSFDTSQNSIDFGIDGDGKAEYLATEDNKKVAIISEGQLWYYNYRNTSITRVYGFYGDGIPDISELSSRAAIKILSIDEDGVIRFIVYGRIPRGIHEGENGILLYEYKEEDSVLTECSFVSTNISYDIMNVEAEKFAYYEESENALYLFIDSALAKIVLDEGKIEYVIDNLGKNDLYVSANGSIIAYNKETEDGAVKKIEIWDFAENHKEEISSRYGALKIIGFMDNDLVYGDAYPENVHTGYDELKHFKFSEVVIEKATGEILKNYFKENILVNSVDLRGSNIYFTREYKNDPYTPCVDDYITYKGDGKEYFIYEQIVADATRNNVLYLTLPVNIYLKRVPSEFVTKSRNGATGVKTVLQSTNVEDGYFIFEEDGLAGIYESDSDAIKVARENQGLVLDGKGNVIYRNLDPVSYNTVAGTFGYQKCSNNSESFSACLYMSILSAGGNAEFSSLLSTSDWKEGFKATDRAVGINLSGNTIETALLYLGHNIPFTTGIKTEDGSIRYILVVSYNSTHIRYYDPVLGTEVKVTMKKFRDTVKEAGNIIYTYSSR